MGFRENMMDPIIDNFSFNGTSLWVLSQPNRQGRIELFGLIKSAIEDGRATILTHFTRRFYRLAPIIFVKSYASTGHRLKI